MSLFRALIGVCGLVFACSFSPAGEPSPLSGYPSKPIQVIVPFSAGGGLDLSIRLLATYAEPELGQRIDILNMTRGGNIQGNLHAVRAAPDGYVLGCWGMGLVTDELIIRNCPYTHNDVIPLCMYSNDPHVIVVNAAFARERHIFTLRDLVEYVRRHPGKVMFGMGGNWTSHDFVRIKIEESTGITFVRLPFLGGAPALAAAAEGNCDVATPFIAEFLPLARSDKVIALAVTHPERLAVLPDVPTTAEAGYPDLVHSMWRVITVPKHTPQELVTYLASVFQRAVAHPEYANAAREMGINTEFKGPEELPGFVEAEFLRLRERIEALGLHADGPGRGDAAPSPD